MIRVTIGKTVYGVDVVKEYTYSQLQNAAEQWSRRLQQGGISEADREEGHAIVAAADWEIFRRQVQGENASEDFEW